MELRVAHHPERALYERMEANLLASWERYATGSPDAHVERTQGAAVAVFPSGPERGVYNNAVLAREVTRAGDAIDAIAALYSEAGVERYAVWAHESDRVGPAELERRGYCVDTWTRAMAMSLDSVRVLHSEIDVATAGWRDYLRMLTRLGVPDGLLAGVDARGFDVRVASIDGEEVATALAYDHDGDCGIYNVGTLPHARRRGLATALSALLVNEAAERGCKTASLQATAMAERIYAAVGFRDLGRFIEYVPRAVTPINFVSGDGTEETVASGQGCY
ncbi:MAG: GNAT family N-acetyltransferase [Thermoleophilaceae bacterium]